MAASLKSKFVFILFIALSVNCIADEDSSKKDLTKGWYIFGGIDAGFSTLPSSIVGEENKSGIGGNLKALASRYWDKWVFDGGIGIEYKSISGTRPSGLYASLETRTLLLETDLRRRLDKNWELGIFLAANTLADVSHRAVEQPILLGEASKGIIFLTGIQGLYQTFSGTTPLRFGLRLGTDLNISNRQLFEIQGVLQVGFPMFGKPTDPNRNSAAINEKPEYFEINLLRVLFETDSSNLTPKSKEILTNLGKYFQKHLDSFTRIEIHGHTDRQGGHVYNLGLSQNRADAVARVITSQGVPPAIVLTKGYGFTRPLVQSDVVDQPKNRRVIIQIYGSGDKKEFIEELKKIVQ